MKSTAFVFPGQGSQSVGMLSDLATTYPLVTELFQSVSDHLDYDVWSLIQKGPESQLNQTEYTQVAMLVADVAVYRVLQQEYALPAMMMAGHSLGEYAALVTAEAIELPWAAELVSMRGRLMQNAMPLGMGAMAAVIGLPNETVEGICQELSSQDEQVMPANYNAIGQVVIAGHTHLVTQAINKALDAGAMMAKMLPVSVPCHCSLLKETAVIFSEYLQRAPFKVPVLPVISNVDLSIYQSVEQIRHLLAAQLYSPVRWVETIALMKKQGIERVIESGPGKVLTGLTKRIEKSLQSLHVNDSASLAALGSSLDGEL
jgi:[acyl-carrier-protein] S-malonyltransferase